MSNSLLVDLDNDDKPGNSAAIKKQLSEAIAESHKGEDKATTAPDPDDLPEKYRGKSRKELAEMHMNAESQIGRVGNEIGQYKELTDRLLQLKRSEDLQKGGADPDDIDDEPEIKLTSTELLDDPTSAVSRLVESKLARQNRQKEKKDAEARLQEQQREFATKHPDAESIASNQEFITWIQNSPTRSVMAVNASKGDLLSGDALLTEWKELQKVAEENKEENSKESSNISNARRASTESRGASHVSDAPKGKVYRRIDLIRLKLEDPEAYGDESFQREIMQAYAEGRVK